MRELYENKQNYEIDPLKYDVEIFNLSKKYPLKGKNDEILALNNINLKYNCQLLAKIAIKYLLFSNIELYLIAYQENYNSYRYQ